MYCTFSFHACSPALFLLIMDLQLAGGMKVAAVATAPLVDQGLNVWVLGFIIKNSQVSLSEEWKVFLQCVKNENDFDTFYAFKSC